MVLIMPLRGYSIIELSNYRTIQLPNYFNPITSYTSIGWVLPLTVSGA